MKWLELILVTISCFLTASVRAQERSALSLNLGYFNNNDRLQYLVANAKTKVNGKFRAQDSVSVRFFLSDESPGHLLGKAITDARGNAVLFIPPSAKDEWDKSPKQSFIAMADSSPAYEAASATLDIIKAKIKLDTGSDKNIVATVLGKQSAGWTPVKGVDVILAVKRLGSNLNVTASPTYTTDSSGKVNADFKLQQLPGDDSGNLVLVAKLDANDSYGTITKEKKVPWGIPRQSLNNFDKRTLYARRGLSPIWLGFIAYSIAFAVWGVIIYLIFQIRKMRKIGAQFRPSPK